MENDDTQVKVGRIFPGGIAPSSDELAVAALIGGGLLLLWGIRKGISGLGAIELAGSTISALEFTGYLMVVGGTIRVIQAQEKWAGNPLVRALGFVY